MSAPRGIEIVENAFVQNEEMVRHLDALDHWEASRIGKNPGISDLRTSSTCTTPIEPGATSSLFDDLRRNVVQLFKNYSFTYNVNLTSYEPTTFNRYKIHEKFSSHADYFEGSNRVVSAVLFLNDVGEGGELLFTFFGYTIRPVAGRAVIFPSNYLFAHEALPPRSEAKYSAAFWARG
jgi:predicted 2-oxoglutarate/Fe(II)-dependent dioxygenase YbiX